MYDRRHFGAVDPLALPEVGSVRLGILFVPPQGTIVIVSRPGRSHSTDVRKEQLYGHSSSAKLTYSCQVRQ